MFQNFLLTSLIISQIEDPEILPIPIKNLVGKSFCFGLSITSDNVSNGSTTFKVAEVWSGDHIHRIESLSEPVSLIGSSSSTLSTSEVRSLLFYNLINIWLKLFGPKSFSTLRFCALIITKRVHLKMLQHLSLSVRKEMLSLMTWILHLRSYVLRTSKWRRQRKISYAREIALHMLNLKFLFFFLLFLEFPVCFCIGFCF